MDVWLPAPDSSDPDIKVIRHNTDRIITVSQTEDSITANRGMAHVINVTDKVIDLRDTRVACTATRRNTLHTGEPKKTTTAMMNSSITAARLAVTTSTRMMHQAPDNTSNNAGEAQTSATKPTEPAPASSE